MAWVQPMPRRLIVLGWIWVGTEHRLGNFHDILRFRGYVRSLSKALTILTLNIIYNFPYFRHTASHTYLHPRPPSCPGKVRASEGRKRRKKIECRIGRVETNEEWDLVCFAFYCIINFVIKNRLRKKWVIQKAQLA